MLTTEIDAENPVVHDLRLVNGQLDFVKPTLADIENYSREVAQRIKTRLLLERGTWYQDQREGVPWKTRVLGKSGVALGLDQVRDLIYTVVASTPGVERVNNIELDLDGRARTLSVTLDATVATSREIRLTGLTLPIVVTP
jgi:hypothetical protein